MAGVSDSVIYNATLFKVATDTKIPAKSQCYLPVNKVNNQSNLKTTSILVEPINFSEDIPNNCMIAKSIHVNDEVIYCQIINASDKEVVFEKNKVIGRGFEIDEEEIVADELNLFYKNVGAYERPVLGALMNNANVRLNNMLAKTNSSIPVPPDNITMESFITTKDVMMYEYRNKLKELKFNTKLSLIQKAQLAEIILNNNDVFQWDPTVLGHTKLAVHSINTGNNFPVAQKQYIIPNAAKQSLLDQRDEMLNMNVIRESSSPWRSPVLLVRKKADDGSIQYRFCIDLKKVNSLTSKDCYSLPLIQETVDALNGAQYFSTLDVDRAFWEIPVLKKDKKKLAFMVDGKLYEFNVMPFGSMNAPATFQRLIDRVLRGLTWRQCLVYIDDVLIFSKTFDQHLLDLDEVMNRFRYSGLKLKPSKCKFAMQEVDYLGFKITKDGMRVSDKKIDAIIKLKPPDTNKLLYSFLCGINYYRSLIPMFGELTVKLYRMAEDRKKKCVWSTETINCFEKLKQAIITAPVLAFPDFTKDFVINTDASMEAISGVLLQKQNGIWKPISFFSRKLTPTEKRYSAAEREMLAVRESYFDFINLVFDRRIIFLTDHEPLVTAHRLKNPMGRLARMFNDLVDVTYKMEYVPGKLNYLPDFLSRASTVDVEQISSNLTEVKSKVDWATAQNDDVTIKQVKIILDNHVDRLIWFKLKNGKRWWAERHSLYMNNDVLMHSSDKIVCPESMKALILHTHHDIPFSGHRGADTTLVSIRSKYFWFGMSTDTVEYCQSCVKCQKFNYANIHNVAPLKNIIVHRPFQLLGVDFMGPFKRSKSGNYYILIVIDHWTKYVVAVALPSFTAELTARAIIDNVVCKFGMFESILSDQGVNFEANLTKEVCRLLGAEKLHTTTYNGAGNGITERVNKNVKPNLAKYVNDDHSDWDEFLQLAASAYNSAVHSSIGMSPFEALFARPPVNVIDTIISNSMPNESKMGNVHEFVRQLKLKAVKINGLIEENTRTAQAKQKYFHDRTVKDAAKYKVNDLVKINNFRVRPNHSKAFEPKFIGPCKILEVVGDLSYKILDDKNKIQVVHYKRLNHYNERNSEKWDVNIDDLVPIVGVRSISSLDEPDLDVVSVVQSNVRRSIRLKMKRIQKAAESHWLELNLEFLNAYNLDEDEILPELEGQNINRRLNNLEIFNRYEELERTIILDDDGDQEQDLAIIGIERLGFNGFGGELLLDEPWLRQVPLDLNVTFEEEDSMLADQTVLINDPIYANEVVDGNQVDNDVELVVLNNAGKPTTICPRCGVRYESKYGIRAHLRSCTR